MVRSLAIWATGLVAAVIIGGGIGSRFQPDAGTLFGMIAGPAAFACVRLWLMEHGR
jgi:hypothetical protein